jgi:hypothetical protein
MPWTFGRVSCEDADRSREATPPLPATRFAYLPETATVGRLFAPRLDIEVAVCTGLVTHECVNCPAALKPEAASQRGRRRQHVEDLGECCFRRLNVVGYGTTLDGRVHGTPAGEAAPPVRMAINTANMLDDWTSLHT